MASRGFSGVLESTSLTSLNAIHGVFPAQQHQHQHQQEQPRKRKFSQIDADEPPDTIISIKGHASSLSDDEFNLSPIELLPRSALPLTWLDSTTAIQSGNIFVSNNKLLEDIFAGNENLATGTKSTTEEPLVLIARLTSTGALYVVEQVKKRIYALTKLQSHVDEGEVRVTAKSCRFWNSTAPRPVKQPTGDGIVADWREAARVPDPGDSYGAFLKKTKLDVSVSFRGLREDAGQSQERTQSADDSVDNVFVSELQAYVHAPPEEQAPLPQLETGMNDEAAPSAEAILDSLRLQYLDALYISKTSVAYFAKGPLTRSRNTFQNSNPEGSGGCSDLLAFYKDSILSVKKMDTKYRESLPTILQNIVLVLSEDERPRKRRSRKKKLGRNGLYPGEDEFIKRCWRSRQLVDRGQQAAHVSKDDEIKRLVSDLRLRETQLQILLILEALYLQNSLSSSSAQDTNNAKDENGSGNKREKAKKGEDLNVLLELLLDRLCIWHAVSAVENNVVAESVKDRADSHLSGKKIESDALRDFCNEVIIPFYASRLPEQCKAIRKKLGGAAAEPSPSRPTPDKRSSKMSSSKTTQHHAGTVDRRTQPLKPRRTLQRVLTDEQVAASQRTRHHPSLMRSSTTPALQETRAESLEPSLPPLGSSVRGGIQAARRVDKREIDLNAVAKQHETKIKKMGMLMEQKKELEAAISALRKPNRELVAKELAEQAEKRASLSARKPKNPVRNPHGQGVQVMATPKASRKKDVGASLHHPSTRGTSRHSGATKDDLLGTSPALGSDASLVPQSSMRSSTSSSVDTRQREVNAVNETPSRGASKLSDPLGSLSLSDVVVETPTANTTQYARTLFKVPTLPLPPAPPPPPPATNAEVAMKDQTSDDNNDNLDDEISISTPVPLRRSIMTHDDDLRLPPDINNNNNNNTTNNTIITTPTIHETPPRPSRFPGPTMMMSTSNMTITSMASPSSPTTLLLIDDTPVKKRGILPRRQEKCAQETPEKSIYEQLGWDDEDLAL